MKHIDYAKKAYYDFYINHNLATVFKYFEVKWLDPMDIKNHPKLISGRTNSYLQNDNYDETLVKDILLNGMYWPYMISDTGYICEGCHRIKSIKDFYGTIWPEGKKVCTIIQPMNVKNFRKYTNENGSIEDLNNINEDAASYLEQIKLDKPVYMWISDDKMFWKYLLKKINYAKEHYDTPIGNFYLVQIDNLASMLDCLIHMHIKLREDLFIYHNTDNMIPTFDGINNYEDFLNWSNNNFEKVDIKNKKIYKNHNFAFIDTNVHIDSGLKINNIPINNLIRVSIKDDTIKLTCSLDSNLITMFDYDEKNILTMDNKAYDIKKILKCAPSHSDELRFLQVLYFSY